MAASKRPLSRPRPTTGYPFTCFAVIPIFRQGEAAEVLARFPAGSVDRIFVVSDGASEADRITLEAARAACRVPVEIVFRTGRGGVGSAIVRGLRAGVAAGFDVALVMAGNGKDDPREIPRLLDAIAAGADYAQGSRYLPGGVSAGLPWYRRITNRVWPLFWRAVTGYPTTEVTNGFRAYRVRVLSHPAIDLDQDWLARYGMEYYLHFKVLTLGFDVREVPVTKRYDPAKGSNSKINPLTDWWDIGRPFVLLTLRLRR